MRARTTQLTTAVLVAALVGGAAIGLGLWGCEDAAVEETTTPPGTIFQGAGCSEELPEALPYQPGCCEHVVYAPELDQSGFDVATLGAAPAPEHVHASWAGPPESSFAVNWKTDVDTTATQLLYADNEQAVAAADGAGGAVKRVLGHHLLFGGLLDPVAAARVHEVHVCGLSPGTVYYYKVGAPGAWSPVYDLATAPTPGSTDVYRFVVVGDSRDDPQIFAAIQQAVMPVAVDFQIFTGDLVNLSGLQAQWDAFFAATTGMFRAEEQLARAAFMPVNGNHDALSVNYVAQFALPQDISAGELAQGEEWYSFDYANAHFVMLNDTPLSSAVSEPQKSWMEADLGAVDRTRTPWIFAVHHRGFYQCGGSHEPDLELRAAWQPIFDRHQVDMALTGHNHFYQRSLPIRGLQGTEGVVAEQGPEGEPVNQSGTAYVTAGGAGADLYGVDTSCPYIRQVENESVYSYVLIEIQDKTMRYTAYRLDGSVLDDFTLTKN